MIISRARQLEYVDEQQESSFALVTTEEAGFAMANPVDELVPPEQPILLRDAVLMLLQNGALHYEI